MNNYKIISLSTLILFSELMLIRWIGTEVSVFAYLQNVILICSFIGISCGMIARKQHLFHSLIALTIIAIFLSLPFLKPGLDQISTTLSVFGQSFIAWNPWDDHSISYIQWFNIYLGLIVCLTFMILVGLFFVPLGYLLGEYFRNENSHINTYLLNLIGSLVGILLFVGLSYFQQPPFIWIITTLLLIIPLITSCCFSELTKIFILSIILIIASAHSSTTSGFFETRWSPYQKLSITEVTSPPNDMTGKWITVNGNGYQIILDLSTKAQEERPDLYDKNLIGYSHYDIPFRFHTSSKSALLIGAGSGNDVAGALRTDIKSATAVEIDPAILEFGRKYHPEKPYQDPRVNIVTDDARAYLESTNDKFDIISFGLLDSHTSGQMTNARLDHYVYTKEALIKAKNLLNSKGIISLTFEASKDYIISRFNQQLIELFDNPPLVFKIPRSSQGFGGVMFITGNQDTIATALKNDSKLAELSQKFKISPDLSEVKQITDNWPYIYLDNPRIPSLFIITTILVLLTFYSLRKITSSGQFNFNFESAETLQFFFLGAGFLLLETSNISRSAMVLGSAWHSSAAIISGIIFASTLGTFLSTKYKVNINAIYVALILSCIFVTLIDLNKFSDLNLLFRFLIVGTIICMPVIFSGIIFGDLFTKSSKPDIALAANTLGAVLGALLQCCSFLFGVRFLLLLVLIFYSLSLVIGKRWKNFVTQDK